MTKRIKIKINGQSQLVLPNEFGEKQIPYISCPGGSFSSGKYSETCFTWTQIDVFLLLNVSYICSKTSKVTVSDETFVGRHLD